MSKPIGRSDDMLIIRGVNVFPSQIEEVLMSIPEIEPHYQIVVDRKGYLDVIEVWVEVGEDIFAETMGDLERFQRSVQAQIYNVLNIQVRGQAQGAQDDPALRGQGGARRRQAQGALHEGPDGGGRGCGAASPAADLSPDTVPLPARHSEVDHPAAHGGGRTGRCTPSSPPRP